MEACNKDCYYTIIIIIVLYVIICFLFYGISVNVLIQYAGDPQVCLLSFLYIELSQFIKLYWVAYFYDIQTIPIHYKAFKSLRYNQINELPSKSNNYWLEYIQLEIKSSSRWNYITSAGGGDMITFEHIKLII